VRTSSIAIETDDLGKGFRAPRCRPEFPNQQTLPGEIEIQARWFAGEFGRSFLGTCGERIDIVQFGTWNHCAGPDFSDAAVRVNGGPPRMGAVEIDQDVRDWEHHRHSQNPRYDEVVLHAFQHEGRERSFSRTSKHRDVPQIRLPHALRSVGPVVPVAAPGRCSRTLETLSAPELESVLREAAWVRFERKRLNMARAIDAHGEVEALFQAFTGALGYPHNQLAFKLLAQRLPLRRLFEDGEAAEALLFGVAGLLPGPDLTCLPGSARAYSRNLWQHWWPHRDALQALSIPCAAWQCAGQRPVNHPQRRLGAAVALLTHWRALVRSVRVSDWKGLRLLLGKIRHPFWSIHFTFSSPPVAQPIALFGQQRIDDFFINVFLPFAGSWETLLTMRAPTRNQKIQIATSRILARRTDSDALLRSAVNQQGLLQLYEDFCLRDSTSCERCPFPEQIAESRRVHPPSLEPQTEIHGAPNST